jgi:hypothetical protein
MYYRQAGMRARSSVCWQGFSTAGGSGSCSGRATPGPRRSCFASSPRGSPRQKTRRNGALANWHPRPIEGPGRRDGQGLACSWQPCRSGSVPIGIERRPTG